MPMPKPVRLPGTIRPDYGRTSRHFRSLAATVRSWRRPCALMLPGCRGIDYTAPPRHPQSFTADHIIPREVRPDLAEVLANLQPACWHCNAVKGNGQNPKPDIGNVSSNW
jgi:hypothetical protein